MTDSDEEIEEMRDTFSEVRRFQAEMRARRYVRILAQYTQPKIELTPFTTDEYGTMNIGKWGGWLVQLVPMAFNERLVLTPESFPHVYDHGWCYDKDGAAFLAAIAWDPATEAEPPGYKKRATHLARRAGETASGVGPGLEYAAGIMGVMAVLGDSGGTRD